MNNEITEPVISIGTLADKVSLSVSAIRKYEDEGLLISHRTDSGHRLFCYEDIERIQTIQYMIKELGFNIEGIRRMQALLPCWDLLPCNRKERDVCPAFRNNNKSCWMIKYAPGTSQGNLCRKCIVYHFGTLHLEDLKTLLYNQSVNREYGKVIHKIMNKNRHTQKEEK
jgi:MerR family transcriptional regulator/heat shock protein HspR